MDRRKNGDRQLILWFFAVATAVKLLLIPSYRSTDFEVHRNWLAITHSLPLSKWYFDKASSWTLDYPPFFAYFEHFLSIFVRHVDPRIVDLKSGLNYSTGSVIYFQRISVIVSDLCLLYGVYRLTKKLEPVKQNLICALVIWSPELLIVDHIHFQYNGFLLGWLLLSISFMQEDRDLLGGFLFAVLLCFKHLFAVAASVYFIYLLRHYCWSDLATGFRWLVTIGAVVVAVFTAAYGPFIYHGHITPLTTFAIVLLAVTLCLLKAWQKPHPGLVARWIAYVYMCGFLFGWHIHEKASLHYTIPLTIVAVQSLEDAKHYFLVSIVSCYSLFPLLYEPKEYMFKVLLLLLHSMVMWLSFAAQYADYKTRKKKRVVKSRASLGLEVLRRAI